MHNLIKDALEQPKLLTSEEKPRILCEVFKDNQAAHHLALNQQLLVRTKHFAAKHHFFWQFVHHASQKEPRRMVEHREVLNRPDER